MAPLPTLYGGRHGWLEDLKLRASFGTAGNNNIPSGQLVQMFESKATSWINGFSNYWAPSKVMANPDLKWRPPSPQRGT